MRCMICGKILPPGVSQCPFCGGSADAAPSDPRYAQNPPPAEGGYGFASDDARNTQNRYATPAFHTYRKQVFTGFPQNQEANYQGHTRDSFSAGSAMVRSLSDLPQVIRTAFVDPMGTMQGMMRRDDRLTGGMLGVLSLILAFLAGMILTKGILATLFSAMSGLTGLQLAESAASLNQGVNYIAGKVAVSVGGIAALCQLIVAFVPVAMTMVYLSVFKQIKFSFLMASNFAAIVFIPNVLALVLAAVFSLVTPYLALLVLFLGQVNSYVLLCNMTVQTACTEPDRVVPVQAALVCLSELVKLILIAVIGGMMMSGAMQTLSSLTNSVSGLL